MRVYPICKFLSWLNDSLKGGRSTFFSLKISHHFRVGLECSFVLQGANSPLGSWLNIAQDLHQFKSLSLFWTIGIFVSLFNCQVNFLFIKYNFQWHWWLSSALKLQKTRNKKKSFYKNEELENTFIYDNLLIDRWNFDLLTVHLIVGDSRFYWIELFHIIPNYCMSHSEQFALL